PNGELRASASPLLDGADGDIVDLRRLISGLLSVTSQCQCHGPATNRPVALRVCCGTAGSDPRLYLGASPAHERSDAHWRGHTASVGEPVDVAGGAAAQGSPGAGVAPDARPPRPPHVAPTA